MKKIITGEPTFWSPEGTSTILDLKEIRREEFNDPCFTDQDINSFENEDDITFGVLQEPVLFARTVNI